jgi:putative transposase
MRKSKFSESQIVGAIKQSEAGIPVQDICRELGIGRATFYKWKSKYGGLEVSDLKRLKELEAENRRLKQMYAESELQNRVLKDVIEKKL